MVKHKYTRRKRQHGGFFWSSEPEDPYAPKSSFLGSIGSYFSSATEKTNTGLGTMASSIGNSASNLTNSISNTVSSLNPLSSSPSSSSSSYSPSSSPSTYDSSSSGTSNSEYSVGGRRRRRTKRRKTMKGGKGGLGLSYYASDVSNSGLKVAEPTYFIKGGSKRRRKTRKHRKHKKY